MDWPPFSSLAALVFTLFFVLLFQVLSEEDQHLSSNPRTDKISPQERSRAGRLGETTRGTKQAAHMVRLEMS